MANISYTKFFDIREILKSIRLYLPKLDEEKFLQAYNFAELAHRGQLRKDNTTPYITHPVEVVKILISLHADEDTLISALLHDVPEDTEYELDEIEKLFGEKVAFLVDGITKLSKVQYKDDMPSREIESLKKIFLHSGKDLRVIMIKLADRLHNMQTLSNVAEESKRRRIARETLEIYVPIANLLCLQDLKSRLEDLCFKNLLPEEYEKLAGKRKEQEPRRLKLAGNFMKIISETCKKNRIAVKPYKIKKSLYSIYKKLLALGKTSSDVDDRIAIRIIVKSVGDCYTALGLVHSKFVPINDRFRDYIANPKATGYQSLHSTVFGVDGVLTEVQIRTEKMDFKAENGAAASVFEDSTANDERHLHWVSKILEIEKKQNDNEEFLEDIKGDVLQDRIFVFTPKGSPIDLPKGATALDFAYAIHSDIGNHALKAEIKGKILPISATLHTGDVVKIIISQKTHPELAWLSLIKTSLAKNRILEYFRRIGRDKKISEGHKILQKELDIAGLGMFENFSFKKLSNSLMEEFGKNYRDKETLFVAIAEGAIKAQDVAKITYGRHFIKKSDAAGGLRVSLKIVAKNRFGLLRDIYEVLYKNVQDMYYLKGWTSKQEENAFFVAEVHVADLETVSHTFDQLQQIDGVISVYRFSTKGRSLFFFATFLTASIWVAHPFILHLLSGSSLVENHPWVTNFVIYFGLLCLIVTVLYLTMVVQKYFPVVRQKKLLWVVLFTIPVLATLVLLFELFYFQLKLSWLVILIEISSIYGYLIMSYINFRKITRQT